MEKGNEILLTMRRLMINLTHEGRLFGHISQIFDKPHSSIKHVIKSFSFMGSLGPRFVCQRKYLLEKKEK